jgi:hypothetical protein
MKIVLCGILLVGLAACAAMAERQKLCPVDGVALQRRIVYGPGPTLHLDPNEVWIAFAESTKLYTPASKLPYAMPTHSSMTPDGGFTEKETILFCPECEKRKERAWQAFVKKWRVEHDNALQAGH